jgi:hypothetical protein
MVPAAGVRNVVGPAYASRIIEFLSHPTRAWRPRVAAERSPSLARCLRVIEELVRGNTGRSQTS